MSARPLPAAVTSLAARLSELTWMSDLLVAGSLATGDHVPGVSDLDLVAVVDGPVDATRRARLVDLHVHLDRGPAA
jgi:Nucleotidyltransferase domain